MTVLEILRQEKTQPSHHSQERENESNKRETLDSPTNIGTRKSNTSVDNHVPSSKFNRLHHTVQRGPKATSLVARSSRGRCAQHLHDTRAMTHIYDIYANFARNICVTYAPDLRQMRVTSANPTQCCAHLPREERAIRDVTFGPLCTV
jgi:hypothetical protein